MERATYRMSAGPTADCENEHNKKSIMNEFCAIIFCHKKWTTLSVSGRSHRQIALCFYRVLLRFFRLVLSVLDFN